MDNLKLGKIKDLINSVFKTLHLFSKYLKTGFDLRKSANLNLKRRIYHCTRVTLPHNLHRRVS